MKIRVYDSYEKVSRAAADLIAAQLLLKPDSHLGLTAGSTPVGMFKELITLYKEGSVSFADAWFYNLEEMVGFGPEDEGSCYKYLRDHLLDHVDAKLEHLRLPDGLAEDIDNECEKYEALFNGLPEGRLDMQVLGLGTDAHIGMNKPDTELLTECYHVNPGTSHSAVAMGMRSMLLAKRIVLIATGENKAQAVAEMCSKKITTQAPATFLQLHPDVTIIVDKAAASKI
jgi:6-phosphogluconolactonase/Glucosamine-6-phosphate isomerase/deaminase